jgi:type I restriction-modification system DNA methylase subunit
VAASFSGNIMDELKELYKNILEEFDAGSVRELVGKMGEFILANKTAVFEKYIPLCPDFETDYLQKLWQFYEADRDEKKQDYTPACLGELLSELAGTRDGTVYDCCAGSGSLAIQRWIHAKNTRFICEELDERVIPFLLFNLAVRNIEGYVINGNALTGKRHKIYKLEKGDKYAFIKEAGDFEFNADFGICNPPYNISWEHGQLFDDRFIESGTPPAQNANFAFVLHVLSRIKERAAVILPTGALSSTAEKDMRKYLVDKGLVEAVITLPEHMFESTGIPVCVLCFDKTKKHDQVVFIDHEKIYETKIREQRGEDEVHYQRMYKKELKIITKEHIKKIVQTIQEKNEKIEYSGKAHSVEIKEKDYELIPARYVEYVNRRKEHRPFKEIANDINRCIREKNILKLTVNETIARNMGLDDLAELMKENNRISETMNTQGIYKRWGIEFAKEAYITLTKNKNEIKIENISKEEISFLLGFMLPHFSQNIFYQNNRENEYLAELRDALLPGLMNGSIPV